MPNHGNCYANTHDVAPMISPHLLACLLTFFLFCQTQKLQLPFTCYLLKPLNPIFFLSLIHLKLHFTMSFLYRSASRQLPRTTLPLYTNSSRLLSTSLIARKSATETAQEKVDQANKAAGQAGVAGIEKGRTFTFPFPPPPFPPNNPSSFLFRAPTVFG